MGSARDEEQKMSTLKAAKRKLRQNIKRLLAEVPPEIVRLQCGLNCMFSRRGYTDSFHLASAAVKTLLSLPQYHSAQTLSVYLSMPTGEISTAAIVHDAMNRGKQVFVPYTYKIDSQPSSIMDMLELKSLEDYAAFEPDKWGIPTPRAESVALRRNSFGTFGMSDGKIPENSSTFGLDLIVVPGMAFDRNMGRLGHGKGFYDYFFERCHRQSVQGKIKMPFLGTRRYSSPS